MGKQLNKPIVLVAISLALCSLGLGVAISRVQPPALTSNDFTPDYVSAKALVQGEDPYGRVKDLIAAKLGTTAYLRASIPEQINSHPPIFIVLIVPLAALPFPVARLLWLFLSAVAILLATGLTSRRLGWSIWQAISLASLALCLPVVQKELLWGQANGLLLLLLVLGWIWVREGRDRAAGMALGLAAAVKILPILLLIPLARSRSFKATRWFIGSSIVSTAAGGLIVGPGSSAHFLRGLPKDARYWRGIWANVSPIGDAFRWLTASRWMPHALNLPTLANILGCLIVVGCILAILKTPGRRSRDPYLAAIPWMLLATPLLWTPELLVTIPVLLGMLRGLATERWRRTTMEIMMIGAGVIVMIGALEIIGDSFSGIPTNWSTAIYNVPMIALVILGISDWSTPQISEEPGVGRAPLVEAYPA